MKTEKVFILFDGTKSGNVGESFKYDQVSLCRLRRGDFMQAINGTKQQMRRITGISIIIFMEEVTRLQYSILFGYGLSYTTFDWKVVNAPGKREKITADGSYKITVEVTNTGERAGKEVVQLYYAPPYEAGGIEKSAVVLADYAKTGELQPGGKRRGLRLSVKARDMASYDFLMTAIKNGFLQDMSWIRGTYVLFPSEKRP